MNEQTRAWLAAQIDERRPGDHVEVGPSIQALASAIVGMERGGGTVFGMTLSAPAGVLAPYAARARDALSAWRDHLRRSHGAEADDFVATICARSGLVIAAVAAPAGDAGAIAAVAELTRVLGDPDAITAAWGEHDNLDDDLVVAVALGTPDPAALDTLVARERAALDYELPLAYVELLRTYGGIATFLDETGGVRRGGSVGGSTIWPVDSYGHHTRLASVDIDAIERPFIVGSLGDSGYFVLDADGIGATWWQDRTLSVAPTRLADSFEAFVRAYAAARLDVRYLLRAARTPGWGTLSTSST